MAEDIDSILGPPRPNPDYVLDRWAFEEDDAPALVQMALSGIFGHDKVWMFGPDLFNVSYTRKESPDYHIWPPVFQVNIWGQPRHVRYHNQFFADDAQLLADKLNGIVKNLNLVPYECGDDWLLPKQ